MNYEIQHGQRTHFIQAGNPWAACLEALHDEAMEDSIQQAPFNVTPIPMGDTETIPMATILQLQILAHMDVNCAVPTTCVKQVASCMTLTHW